MRATAAATAIVVGAGIGGLAAALSLRRAGCEVTVVEQVSRFAEVGAGIQLAPNATCVLRQLGLLDAVAAQAARPSRMSFRTWSDGTEICRYTLGREVEDEFGAPYLQVHRADLHQALADAVPPDSVRLNTAVVAIDQHDDSASVTTANGEHLTADLVVAADGMAVLGDTLADTPPPGIPDALDRYVHRRLATATHAQAGSAQAGENFHLPDGPEALARNARMVAYAAGNRFGPFAAAWATDAVA